MSASTSDHQCHINYSEYEGRSSCLQQVEDVYMKSEYLKKLISHSDYITGAKVMKSKVLTGLEWCRA